jgi:Spy/CpxP family protein refolding chaperone
MKATLAILFATAFLLVTVAIGQEPRQPGPPPHPPNPDPLAHLMFPPEMIMGHARELNLTEEQKTYLRSEVQKATVTFQDLQWKLQDQMEALHDTMKSSTVNEQQALAQLDKVLDVEREIKRLHIALAVRLKNRLTPEQQDQLHKMMDHHPGMPEN